MVTIMKRFLMGITMLIFLGFLGGDLWKDKTGELFAQGNSDAEFSADTTSGPAPFTVNFRDESTGNILDWSWDFGDGGTSQDQNPTNQYTQPGLYTVTLRITDENNQTDEEVKENYIEVTTAAPGLNADFSANPTSGLPPLTVSFSDESTGGAVRWEWDFDNNGVVDSTVQNPSYIYNQAGLYSVKLTVFDSTNNSDTEVKSGYINGRIRVLSG